MAKNDIDLTKYEDRISSGVLHCHTDNSLRDSALSVQKLVSTAKEKGAKAVELSDHGTMSGIQDFIKTAKDHDIKPIIGVEAYFAEDSDEKRYHLNMMAKNAEGVSEINKIVTLSNERIDSKGMPRVNYDILRRNISKKNVIATSACVSGVLAKPFIWNLEIQKKCKKLKNIPFDEERYLTLSAEVGKEKNRQKELMEEVKQLTKTASKKYVSRRKKAEKIPDEAEREKVLSEIEWEEKETKEAPEKKKKLQEEIKAINTALEESGRKKELKKLVSQKEKLDKTKEQIEKLESELLTGKQIYEEVKELALEFQNIFGKENFFIELQYHGFEGEEEIYQTMAKAARELGIPVVAANDVHIAEKTDECVEARQIVRGLRFKDAKWEDPLPGDREMYIKTDRELAGALLQILPQDVVDEAMGNVKKICEQCNYEPVNGTHYPEFPNLDAKKYLREQCEKGILEKFPKGLPAGYRERMEYELDVIGKMGYCDYLCIVQDFLEYGRKLGLDNPEGVGLAVGPGRGSAAGSLVCFLTGITSIDPIKYGLLFERFLNVERVSMPDIDSDIMPGVREQVIDYVSKKFKRKGKEDKIAVCGIMTKGTMMAKKAIRQTARVLGDRIINDNKALLSLADEMAKMVPNVPKITLADCKEEILAHYSSNEIALKLFHDAELVEGCIDNYSTHAAGVIISDNGDISEYAPLMYTEGQWSVQCDMVQAEENLGLLKMDFLGLKNLKIITDTARCVKRNYGISLDLLNLPFEKEVFEQIFATGFTNFIFQFESPGMKKMLTQFKPETFEDLILLVAAYRPGPMQFLPDVIAVKNGSKKISYLTPELEPILNKTYGAIIYQEQVMEICQKLAGYTLGQADLVRRYMSKKKEEPLAREREAFVNGDKKRNIKGCVNNGISTEIANKLFDEMMDFAKYAFNKSHAAAYALVSYITAYLKHHYFKEYISSAINVQDEKQIQLLSDCKAKKVTVLPPNVKTSKEGFTITENGEILCGLKAIKDVSGMAGVIVEASKKGFRDLTDFVVKTKCPADVLRALAFSGALDEFGRSRTELNEMCVKILAVQKKIDKERTKLDECFAKKIELRREGVTDEKKLKQITQNTAKHQTALELALMERDGIQIKNNFMDEKKLRASEEMEYLGMWLSSNPLKEHESLSLHRCMPIISADHPMRTARVGGAAVNVLYRKTKKDGKSMAVFKLEDESGEISCCMFPRAFEKYGHLLEEGAVLALNGKVNEREYNDEMELQFIVDSIEKIPEKSSVILITCGNIMEKYEIMPILAGYRQKEGHRFIIYDKTFNELQEGRFLINEEVMNRLDAVMIND